MHEFELIYRIFAQQTQTNGCTNAHNIEQGIGDDAAVVLQANAQKQVICTDTMVQGRHFSGDWQVVERLAFAIGYKAVMVNLSDLAAMGATPHSILLAIALPKRLATNAWLQAFANGLFAACKPFDVQLIGGDTTRSEQLVVTVTAQGVAQHCVYRHGAQAGDKIYVSGSLGDASCALRFSDAIDTCLNDFQQYSSSFDIDDFDNDGFDDDGFYSDLSQMALFQSINDDRHKVQLKQLLPLAKRLHMPMARVALGKVLANLATAMIDISDGLYQDLGHICQQSRVSACINLEHLPTSLALESLLNQQVLSLSERLLLQLTGGDDYELLFTLPKDTPSSVLEDIGIAGKVTCIGHMMHIEQQMQGDLRCDLPSQQASEQLNQCRQTPLCRPHLYYQGRQLTKDQPHPFAVFPDLTGYQHF